MLMNEVKPTPKAPVQQQYKAPAKGKNDLSDIDDLLSGIDTAPKKSNPPPRATHDDIDDLLAGIDAPKPKPVAHRPPPAPSNDLDDIDDLLSGMGPSHHSKQKAPAHQHQHQQHHHHQSNDDIDDLLEGIGGMSVGGGGGYHASASYGGNDDIDDLLSDLSQPPRHSHGKGGSSGLEAIDDLLADLTG
jgi:hypothetical protein